MKPDAPRIDQDRTASPHAQEIEYALLLQRMISAVKDDPEQMRLTVYEFARARLKIDTLGAEESERRRLSAALETAIQGVEQFCKLRDDKDRLRPPAHAPQITASTSNLTTTQTIAPQPPATSIVAPARASPSVILRPVTPAPEDILVPERAYSRAETEPPVQAQTRALVSTLARFCIGMLLFVAVVGLAYYKHRLPFLTDRLTQMTASKATSPPIAVSIPGAPQQPNLAAERKPGVAAPPPFPLPSDYGIYAISRDALYELRLLPERVPDKRIAVSTPITKPSSATLPDGRLKFILFRRDLAGNAPDRLEIRVVARVVRALTFDAKGKPGFSPVSDTWNIRSVSHEFRVRPIPSNPEMLLVQSDKADFALPAGRYVLVLRDQGYDFTVAGQVTDLAQCLERTDAANGTFYSECLNF